MIVVIDGPAGAGKSSTAKEVAARTAFRYLDSGAFYRAMTVVYGQGGRQLPTFLDRLDAIRLEGRHEDGLFRVTVDGTDVTDRLRLPETAADVSTVAAQPKARALVNEALRRYAASGDFIGEGRDLGTAVFPDADLKIYLTADLSARAARRLAELELMGQAPEPEDVTRNLALRDRTDASREADPLRKADDAVEIDTTHLGFEEQVAAVIRLIETTQSTTLTMSEENLNPENEPVETAVVEAVEAVETAVETVEPVAVEAPAAPAAVVAPAITQPKSYDGSVSGKVYTLA